MSRVQNNTVKKKRRYKINYLRVILIITLVYFSVTFVNQQLSINEYNVKINNIEQDIEETKAETNKLKEVKDKVNDVDYIEQIAREEYGLVKPYEKIFIDVDK